MPSLSPSPGVTEPKSRRPQYILLCKLPELSALTKKLASHSLQPPTNNLGGKKKFFFGWGFLHSAY